MKQKMIRLVGLASVVMFSPIGVSAGENPVKYVNSNGSWIDLYSFPLSLFAIGIIVIAFRYRIDELRGPKFRNAGRVFLAMTVIWALAFADVFLSHYKFSSACNGGFVSSNPLNPAGGIVVVSGPRCLSDCVRFLSGGFFDFVDVASPSSAAELPISSHEFPNRMAGYVRAIYGSGPVRRYRLAPATNMNRALIEGCAEAQTRIRTGEFTAHGIREFADSPCLVKERVDGSEAQYALEHSGQFMKFPYRNIYHNMQNIVDRPSQGVVASFDNFRLWPGEIETFISGLFPGYTSAIASCRNNVSIFEGLIKQLQIPGNSGDALLNY